MVCRTYCTGGQQAGVADAERFLQMVWDSDIGIIAICCSLTSVAFCNARASNFHSSTKDYDFDLQHNEKV